MTASPEGPSRSVPDQVKHTIADHDMVVPKDKVLAAVSGGPDSVALITVLIDLASQLDITLGIAHVNHLLRGDDASGDETFVRCLARELDLPVHCAQIDVKSLAKEKKLSIEEAGREVRYGFFQQICIRHNYTRVATGHTRDDNAELVLMNLLRGSGLKGLSGIPPTRDNLFIRPLIRTRKQEIIDFLATRGQDFRIDASNTDPAFLRNKIRCHLIPGLEKEYNPSIIDALDRLSRIARPDHDYLSGKSKEALENCLVRSDKTSVVLNIDCLDRLHPAIQSRVLRLAIRRVKADLKRIQMVHLEDILYLCQKSEPNKSLDLPGRIRIYKAAKTVTIKKENLPLRLLGRQKKKGR